MKKTISGINIECIEGDITMQADMTAIVNAANAQLRIGGGVAGAIHSVAGPELEKECLPLAPIRPGEAVITRGYGLPNAYVIHCLGPVYGVDRPSDQLLASCYTNALKIAEENGIDSIAFPAISTGIFGYPMREAAEIAIKTVIENLPKLQSVKRIRFVLFGKEAYRVHREILDTVRTTFLGKN